MVLVAKAQSRLNILFARTLEAKPLQAPYSGRVRSMQLCSLDLTFAKIRDPRWIGRRFL